MDKNWQTGSWLLLDAAGPGTVFGLVQDGEWLSSLISDEPFLEGCQTAVEGLLRDHKLELNKLSGVLYASGPGSTLGLRLAAMFIRSLMQLPELQHWRCAQYNNLELAAASLIEEAESFPVQAAAPWRRDRVHRVLIHDPSANEIESGFLQPDDLEKAKTTLFSLGNRAANRPMLEDIRPYPAEEIPLILKRYPRLLAYTGEPIPYSAETPEFARWSSKRHSAK